MKAIMLMFDTLNLRMLSSYGCDWTITPNFMRLAKQTVTFDNCYAGSLPCMPARRELHTGRYNFLHRSWGPLEPFDDSMPQILSRAGIYTHLISDHQHYWEEGGATIHNRDNSWECVRGQEGDCWKGWVKKPDIPAHLGRCWEQDVINRNYFRDEENHPMAQVYRLGMEFLEKNKNEDNWFLHWEFFDPHEPFFSPETYKAHYYHDYEGPLFDWPEYKKVDETPEQIQHCRYEYAALLTMCDVYLGKILDYMDANDLWKDTMLIVNTDHGFLLGEHDLWAKSLHPWYNETAHIPLFIWDPRTGLKDIRREALVQTIDIPVTLLNFFGQKPTEDMQGLDLQDVIKTDHSIREYALFGMHGAQVNITDGRYVYMRDYVPANEPLYNYTQMPTHMRCLFSVDEMRTASLYPGFSFTKETPVFKIRSVEDKSGDTAMKNNLGTMLFDLQTDPQQQHPIQNLETEERMVCNMVKLMKENDAPKEQFVRLGLMGEEDML